MTVVLREIPGLDLRELVQAIRDIAGTDVPIETGYGGVVVDESLAWRFLRDYLVATGEVDRPAEAETAAVATQADPEQPSPPTPKSARGSSTRRKKVGEP